MGVLSWTNNLDKRFSFAWQFWGFLLAVIFGGISIYTEFVRESVPRLEFEVIGNEPVLDVREKLPDLEVLYQSQDIAKSGKTLSVLLVRVVNRGSADLLNTYYDSKAPIEVRIDGGTLVRADISETSNEYLRRAASATKNASSISLSPVILEMNEWFVVKVLALHGIDVQPVVTAAGKIAGQQNIPVVSPKPEEGADGFMASTFSGSPWTQVVRFLAYPLGFVAISAAIAIPSAMISEARTTRKREAVVRRFKAKTKLTLTDGDEFVFNRFKDYGLRSVQRLTNAVADADRLHARALGYLQQVEDDAENEWDDMDGPFISSRYSDMKDMMKHNFIELSEGKWHPVPDRLKVATAFIEYIELIGGS